MSFNNRLVNSREYKIMLNPLYFNQRKDGSKSWGILLDNLIEQIGAEIDKRQDDEESRSVWYVDSPEHALYQKGAIIRIREKKEDDAREFQVTLRYRSPDRYISAAQSISSPEKGKTKFEEDIIPPFKSVYSHSNSLTLDTLPKLKKLEHIRELFPGLKNLDLADNMRIQKVNNYKATEVSRKLRKIRLDEATTIKATLSFWYPSKDEGVLPQVVEFDFDLEPKKTEEKDPNEIEDFSIKGLEKANLLFLLLQGQNAWLDHYNSTKTGFAYSLT